MRKSKAQGIAGSGYFPKSSKYTSSTYFGAERILYLGLTLGSKSKLINPWMPSEVEVPNLK